MLPSNLTGAQLKGADLTGADLRHAIFTDADVSRANFTGASLQAGRLRRHRRAHGARGLDERDLDGHAVRSSQSNEAPA